jgi:voltage-gated potassium channel
VATAFRLPVLAAALLVVPVIVLEEADLPAPWPAVTAAANWLIWSTFLAELVAMLAVVPDRRAWLRRHPLEVGLVVLTPPFLPATLQAARALRLLRVLRLAITAHRLRALLSLDGLRATGLVALLAILGSGAAFAALEREQHLDAWDGVYWAVTTMTTVGYGDLSPQTEAGRLLAVAVMLTGISFLAVLTGTLAQAVMARVAREEVEPGEAQLLATLDRLDARLTRIEDALAAQRDEARPTRSG